MTLNSKTIMSWSIHEFKFWINEIRKTGMSPVSYCEYIRLVKIMTKCGKPIKCPNNYLRGVFTLKIKGVFSLWQRPFLLSMLSVALGLFEKQNELFGSLILYPCSK